MNRMRKLRQAQKLSQQELASKIKVDRSTVAKWETGMHFPRMNKLRQLTQILKCSFEELFPNHIP
ncbi:helix-turn-helix domain-containing protein [Selenomonas ruminantium]|uniref:helix-turn-helix transcriptional regulator n=1 Tax=Selenomonas ruminantium TaxID=971 RepID=UPI000478C18C